MQAATILSQKDVTRLQRFAARLNEFAAALNSPPRRRRRSVSRPKKAATPKGHTRGVPADSAA